MIIFALFVLFFILALPAFAQESTPSPSATLTITDDQVNLVAKRLYCPVCEDVPLDACGTAACVQWRADIRQQLEQGKTPDEVVADFVRRFGQRVVGTPQDPTLRALSLVTPYLLGGLALAFALFTLWRWRRNRAVSQPVMTDSGDSGGADSDYRRRLERDLRQRQ